MDVVWCKRWNDYSYFVKESLTFLKAVEYILPEQQASIVKELEAHVMRCVKDANGNHVSDNKPLILRLDLIVPAR